MFKRKKPTATDLELAITRAHALLKDAEADPDKYKAQADVLAQLYKMLDSLKEPGSRVSKDAIVAAAASVGSVALILIFEGVGRGIITTKSLGFAPKPKNKTT